MHSTGMSRAGAETRPQRRPRPGSCSCQAMSLSLAAGLLFFLLLSQTLLSGHDDLTPPFNSGDRRPRGRWSRPEVRVRSYAPLAAPGPRELQLDLYQKNNLSDVVIVMLATSTDFRQTERSLRILEDASDLWKIPSVISLLHYSSYFVENLTEKSHDVILTASSSEVKRNNLNKHKTRSWMYDLQNSWNRWIPNFLKSEVCTKNRINPNIKVLHTWAKHGVEERTVDILQSNKTEAFQLYQNHPYNSINLRITNSKYHESSSSEVNMDKQDICAVNSFIKESLKRVRKRYSEFNYFLLVDDQHLHSENLLSYFSQLIWLFDEDPTVYCIGAHNPLHNKFARGKEDETLRVDHFAGRGAVLIHRSLVDEIIEKFAIYPKNNEFFSSNKGAPSLQTDWLELWLSWFSNRRGRGCIIPRIPRVCPIGVQEDEREKFCSSKKRVMLANTTRLISYRFEQSLYPIVETLDVMQVPKNCQDVMSQVHNKSVVMYTKMFSFEDDVTLRHVLKCFGIDVPSNYGCFKGLYTVPVRNHNLYIVTIPLALFVVRFPLIVALPENVSDIYGIQRYADYKHMKIHFQPVEVIPKDDLSMRNKTDS